MDPQQQIVQQQFSGPKPTYHFQQTGYNMMQANFKRTPTTSKAKNNTQNDPETTADYICNSKVEENIEPNRRNNNGRKSHSL
jgi:hypothetical protein